MSAIAKVILTIFLGATTFFGIGLMSNKNQPTLAEFNLQQITPYTSQNSNSGVEFNQDIQGNPNGPTSNNQTSITNNSFNDPANQPKMALG